MWTQLFSQFYRLKLCLFNLMRFPVISYLGNKFNWKVYSVTKNFNSWFLKIKLCIHGFLLSNSLQLVWSVYWYHLAEWSIQFEVWFSWNCQPVNLTLYFSLILNIYFSWRITRNWSSTYKCKGNWKKVLYQKLITVFSSTLINKNVLLLR